MLQVPAGMEWRIFKVELNWRWVFFLHKLLTAMIISVFVVVVMAPGVSELEKWSL